MKEYVPGQGSYKVEEAGSLTGIPTSYDVDHHFGTLTFTRDDVKIKARGVDLGLKSVFNSDHLYSTLIPIVSKGDGPSGATTTPVPSSLMTLPFNQTNFYRFANGWSWKLPFLITGATAAGAPQTSGGTGYSAGWNIFKYSDGEGKIFDLLAAISMEAWNLGTGNHCWTEGYEVTYSPEVTVLGGNVPTGGAGTGGFSPVTIVIPEIQQVITCWVIRAGAATGAADFTVSMSAGYTPVIYLSDGRKMGFTSKGLLASITDAAGVNTVNYSYTSGLDVLIGNIAGSSSRKTFSLATAADYAACSVGDLVIINDEIKVVYAKLGVVSGVGSYAISTSSNFDVAIPESGGVQYTIVKGQLQMMTHTDGRAVKFYSFASGTNTMLAVLLSSNQTYSNFTNGDQFLGVYTISSVNQVTAYQAVNSLAPGNSTGFPAALAANPSLYYSPLQQITYLYGLSLTPSPQTDQITVINDAGAATIYYFQTGGFCTHLWNNSFFHTGKCRRGGSTTIMNIERPDFYIGDSHNYISINRINQNAFYDASKADYQKDANAAEFQENSNFLLGQMAAASELEAATLANSSWNPQSIGSNIVSAAGFALQVAGFAHQIAQQDNDAYIAAHAPAVSGWELVQEQVTANRVVLSSALATTPYQNDVYGCVQLSGPPDMSLKVNATSQDTTKVYIDYTNGGAGTPLQPNDYIFIRGFMSQIQAVGQDTWTDASENYVITTNPLPFTADEGEYVIAVRLTGGKIPNPQTYYGYYLNKPKCVRVELKSNLLNGSQYWKRIDYAYSYKIQGEVQTDTFDEGGFDGSNIEGPELTSFDLSDIKVTSTTVTTSEANATNEIDLYQDVYTFAYDVKNFHKGCDSETRFRYDPTSLTWLFVNATVRAQGRPCFNAGYWGTTAEASYEGGDVTNTANGGVGPRKNVGYRFDVYGRKVNERTVSNSFEGRKIRNKWYQYCCTSQDPGQAADWDLDPLHQFAENYFSSSYGPLMNTFFALGAVGATIEEVDAAQDTKVVFREFDPTYFNVLIEDTIVAPTLINYSDLYSVNSPNWEGDLGGTIVSNPADLRWSADGINFSADLTQLQIGEDALNAHLRTAYTYDVGSGTNNTNQLLTVTRPMGNVYTVTYGTGWASSYIASDWQTLDNNIGGTTQYIVNLYTYDLKGRLTAKTTILSSNTAGTAPFAYGSSAPQTEYQYTYDGLDRLLTRLIGDGTTQTLVYQAVYLDNGDGFYEAPYMIETNYLGFRTKTLYDSKYRVVAVEQFKPSQTVGGNLGYANPLMSNGLCSSPLTPPSVTGQTPAAPANATFAQSVVVNSPGKLTGFSYFLVKTSAASAGAAQAFLGPSSPTNLSGLTAGHTYTLSAWIYLPSQTVVNIANFGLSAGWYAAGAWTYAQSAPQAVYGAWQQVTLTFTVPSGATGAVVSLQIGTAEALNANFYVSDLILQDVTVASEVQISGNWNVYDEGLDKVVQSTRYTTPAEINSRSVITQNTYDNIGRLLQVAQKNTDPNYGGDSLFHVVKQIEYDETLNGVLTYDFVDDNAIDYVETNVYNDWLDRGPIKTVTYTGLGGTGLARTTTNHYRHDGKLVQTDLPNGESVYYQLDNLGKLEKLIHPDGTAERTIYDLNGNVVQTIDRRNFSVSMVYNQSDKEVSRTAIDATSGPWPNRGTTVVATLYTQFGPAQVTQTEDALSIVQDVFQYHFSGKAILRQQIVDSLTLQITYGYDLAGNLVTVTPTGSGASPWTKTFDIVPQFYPTGSDTNPFNRSAVVDSGTGQNVITVEPDYLGLTTDLKYGNYASPTGQMNYGYDMFLRPVTLESGEATPALDITLTRNFVGDILTRVEPANAPAPAINYAYTYDGMRRLTSGEGDKEAYDELSNIAARANGVAYTYQDPTEEGSDQMRVATFNDGTNEYVYSYDANGNPVSVSKGSGWRFSALAFDYLNRLRQVVYSQTDNYWYNVGGLRVKKTENAAGTWTTTYTLFDGNNPLMQEIYNAAGRVQTTFNVIVGGQILAQYKRVYPSTDSVVYFYVDNLGSRRVVLGSGGTVTDRYRYSAWGVVTQDVGTDNLASFTGKDYDATGLIYFNARYHDPMTARFVTEDPARKGSGWYSYCDGNPVNAVDPDGRDPVQISIGANSATKTTSASGNLSDSLWIVSTAPKQISPSSSFVPDSQVRTNPEHYLAQLTSAVEGWALSTTTKAALPAILDNFSDKSSTLPQNFLSSAKGTLGEFVGSLWSSAKSLVSYTADAWSQKTDLVDIRTTLSNPQSSSSWSIGLSGATVDLRY